MVFFRPKYVSFRVVLIISNRTSFTYCKKFALKVSAKHSEKISPFSLLSVPISGFLLFFKAAKSTRRSLGVLESGY